MNSQQSSSKSIASYRRPSYWSKDFHNDLETIKKSLNTETKQ